MVIAAKELNIVIHAELEFIKTPSFFTEKCREIIQVVCGFGGKFEHRLRSSQRIHSVNAELVAILLLSIPPSQSEIL